MDEEEEGLTLWGSKQRRTRSRKRGKLVKMWAGNGKTLYAHHNPRLSLATLTQRE